MGILCEEDLDFDWGRPAPKTRPRSDQSTRCTSDESKLSRQSREARNVAGLIEKIRYLRELGVPAIVNLLP